MNEAPAEESYQSQCTAIDVRRIDEEFARVPSDLDYWNEQYVEALVAWKNAKRARERTWHELHVSLAPNLAPRPGSRGVTVADIEAAVSTDPAYEQACVEEITAEAEKVRLAGLMDAVRTKRDMLMSLGAHVRHTIEQGIHINTPEHRDRELASQP